METLLASSPLFHSVRIQLKETIRYQPYELSIIIPDYKQKIIDHYQPLLKIDISKCCQEAEIPFALNFEFFGLKITFAKPCELNLHNLDMVLNDNLKQLIKKFGVVILQNAYLCEDIKNLYHKNNFPHLNFHSDRGNSHENFYSFYTRDPDDVEQQYPRKASTLFIDNAVAYLQGQVEGTVNQNEKGRRSHYGIFNAEGAEKALFGSIILEQPWSAPQGEGEICMINNHAVLHSSYKHGFDPGYRIGARYLY